MTWKLRAQRKEAEIGEREDDQATYVKNKDSIVNSIVSQS